MDYSNFDFTFTDRELEDFLTMMEQQGGDNEPGHAALNLETNIGLQMQPRPPATASENTFSPASSEEVPTSGSPALYDNAGGVSGGSPGLGAVSSMLGAPVVLKQEELYTRTALPTPAESTSALSTHSSSNLGRVAGGLTLPVPGGVVASTGFPQPAANPFLLGLNARPLADNQAAQSWQPQQPLQPQQQQLQQQQQQLQQQQQAQPTQSGGSLGGSLAKLDGKQHVSHSSVEKQRRDRLNSLIDELSDLVPPSDPKYTSEGATVRRPKHVVLSDAITLLKHLQDKLKLDERELEELKQHSVVAQSRDVNGNLNGRCSGETPPELPSPPESAPLSTGVIVEQAKNNTLYVKVNCRDRRGLLWDIVCSLKTFNLVILTAAVTTTKDGNVYDVFEVKLDDETVTAEDLQCAVHEALYRSAQAEKMRGKRHRAEA